MNVDLIVESIPPAELQNPTEVYKLEVCSEHDLTKRKSYRSILLIHENEMIQRIKLMMFYFSEIKKLCYIPDNTALLSMLERETYEALYEFDSTVFWNYITGNDKSQSPTYFASPISFKVTYFDSKGLERRVGITVDGKSLGHNCHMKDPI